MIQNKKLDLMALVTDTFTIDDAPSAFEKIISDPADSLAVMLSYPVNKAEEKIKAIKYLALKPDIKASGTIVNLAVIGAGSFASRTYLPAIYKDKTLNLKAVATKTGKNSKKMAADFKAEYCTTDYHDIINDQSVDAVIIASRHNLHYQMAMDAITHGKHVMLEKPMALSENDLDSLASAVSDSGKVFAVGYNRRYSALIKKIIILLSKEIGPVMINYRVNAGFIPNDHWSQNREVGGGRIIGEACHFFDVICYLIPANLSNISAERVKKNMRTVIANDNFVSILKFDDGSLGTVTYTALGHNDMPKEYVELFINGKSMVLDDFHTLKLHGFKEDSLNLKSQDKGQGKQFNEFIKQIRGEESKLISLEESVLATRIAIIVDKLLEDV